MHPETFYHIYNHANGDENLFRSDENYHFFLRQWAKYIEPVVETYAYCLMPNHFHFLVRTKQDPRGSDRDLRGFENLGGLKKEEKEKENLEGLKNPYIQSLSNLFNSYTKAFNKMYDRRGSLFIPNFKRKEIDSDAYLTTIIAYIHRNPVHHGFCQNVEDWPHGSYDALLSSKPTKVQRKKVMQWFGDQKSFSQSHAKEVFLPDNSLLIDF